MTIPGRQKVEFIEKKRSVSPNPLPTFLGMIYVLSRRFSILVVTSLPKVPKVVFR